MSQHILIVEDEEFILQFLTLHMENEGYRVTTLTEGGKILETIARDPADLILLDLGLPDGDGLSRLMEIRKISNVPVIILTARQGEQDQLMALGMGSDDYITKPCNPRELTLRVRNVLTRFSGATPVDTRARTGPEVEAGADPGVERRQAPMPSPSPPPASSAKNPEKRSRVSTGTIGMIVIGLLLSGVVYALIGKESPPPAPSPLPVAKIQQAPPSPTPAPVPPSTSSPKTKMIAKAPRTETRLTTEEEVAALSPAEILGYAWVNEVQCGEMPEVPWWKNKSYESIVRYVRNRHKGKWDEYIKVTVVRLANMQDIYGRNSIAVTPDGEVMKGDVLAGYIKDLSTRIKIIQCLAREAKKHEK